MVIDQNVATEPVRVLIVEDSAADVALELHELKRAAIAVEFRVVEDEGRLRAGLTEFAPDVILCDLGLREMTGPQAIKIARELRPETPLIIVTGTVTEQQAVIAMQGGAVDYVLKSNLPRLAVAVLRALEDAEERKRRLVQQRSVDRLSRARDVLSSVNAAVLRIGEQRELFREACRIAYEAGGFADVFVYTARPKTSRWELCAFDGDPDLVETLESIFDDALAAADREGAPIALRTRQPVIVDDIAANAELRELPLYRYLYEHGVRASASFPFFVDNRPAAVMVFATEETGAFDGDEVALIDGMIANLRFALDRIGQQERLIRLSRMRDMIAGVNEAILRLHDPGELFREARRIAIEGDFFSDVFAITITPEARRVKLETPVSDVDAAEFEKALQLVVDDFENGPGAVQVSLRTLRPAVVTDSETVKDLPGAKLLRANGTQAVGSFPLIANGHAIGAMVYTSRQIDYFDEQEIELLGALANNLAFAFERFNEQRKIARLSRIRNVLSSVNELIVRVRDRGTLFRETCRIAYESGGFANVFIFVLSPETQRPELQALNGSFEFLELHERLQLVVRDVENGTTTLETSLRTGRPSVVNDLESDTRLTTKPQLLSHKVRAVGTFPIVVEGRAAGGMCFNTTEVDYFDEEEVALLTSMAADLSFALAHLAQEEKVARLSRIRDILSSVNEAIVRTRDRDELLNEACRNTFRAGGFVNVFVMLCDLESAEISVPGIAGAWESRRGDLEENLRRSADDTGVLETIAWRAMREGKAAVNNDLAQLHGVPIYRKLVEQGVRANGAFPLTVDGHVAGVMLFDTAERGFFDDEEVALLGNLTSNLSFALEGIARMERLVRLSRIRDVLSAVNATIVRLRDRDELFREVCRIVVEVGGLMNAFIAEIDLETRDASIPAFLGKSERSGVERSLRERLRSSEDPTRAEKAIRSLSPSFQNDLNLSGRRGREGVHASGAFPLIVGGHAIGALLVESEVKTYFDGEEVELLTNLANNLSFGLDLLDKQQRVDYLSFYDALTQLPNRTLFYDRLRQDLAAAKRAGKMLALVLLDLSRFSMLNNTLGEHVGDAVLRGVADRLREYADESRIARVAGDRFALCFPMVDDLRQVSEIVTEDGIKIFDAPLVLPDRELHIMTRAGCAVSPNDGDDAETLFQNAEAALLKAKADGTVYRFYAPELNSRLAKQLDLEARLQRAIEEQQFVLFYQPKNELRDRRCVGFEALIRWNDPERGLVPPGDFVPLLEQTGLIISVGRWALGEAVRQYEEWKAAGLRPPHIAVNLSAVQLRQERIVEDVNNAIKGFSGECGLDLEVTESMLMENFDAAIAKLKEVRELGVQLSLDDLGTGYSSLAYLHKLPLNALKIDRSFIVGMDEDADKTSIVSTIISLAQALKLKVVAEGVETEAQARLLNLLRCDQMQGYLIGKPESAETAIRFIMPLPA